MRQEVEGVQVRAERLRGGGREIRQQRAPNRQRMLTCGTGFALDGTSAPSSRGFFTSTIAPSSKLESSRRRLSAILASSLNNVMQVTTVTYFYI